MEHRNPAQKPYDSATHRSSSLNRAAQRGSLQQDSLAERLRRQRHRSVPSGCVQEFEDHDDNVHPEDDSWQSDSEESDNAPSKHPLLKLDTDAKLVRFAMQEPTLRRWLTTGEEADSLAAKQWLEAQRVSDATSDSVYHQLARLRKQHEEIMATLSPAARVNGDPATWSTDDRSVLDRMELVLWFSIYHAEVCDDLKKAANSAASETKTQPSPPKPDKARLRRVALQAAAARDAAQSSTGRRTNISTAPAKSKPVQMVPSSPMNNIPIESTPPTSAPSTPAQAHHSNDRGRPAARQAQANAQRVHIRPTSWERESERERALAEMRAKEEDARRKDELSRRREQAAREREDKARRREETKRHLDKWFSEQESSRIERERDGEQAEWNRKERAREAREATREGRELRADVVSQTEKLLVTLRAESAQKKTSKAEELARREAEGASLEQRGSKRLNETGMVRPDEDTRLSNAEVEQAGQVQTEEAYRREDEKRDQEEAQLEKRIRHLEEVLGLVKAQRERVRLAQDADARRTERKTLREFEEWLSEGGLEDL